MGEVQVPGPQGTVRGYLAIPEGTAAVAGVLVVHEAYGMTDDVRSHADHLAGAGYLALAPDLYGWARKLRCVAATMVAISRGHGRAFDDIEACRVWLAGDARCTGKIAMVGFCMGGGLAIACAPKGGLAAVAPNYGLVPKDAEHALAGACPMVASYGSEDRYMRGAAPRLEAALDALGVPNDVKEYPGASHSFMNHHQGFAAGLDRVMRTGYRADAADDAWARILAFFARHLGEDVIPPTADFPDG